MISGSGNDTIVGANGDVLLDANTGTDTLQTDGTFDDTGVYKVTITSDDGVNIG